MPDELRKLQHPGAKGSSWCRMHHPGTGTEKSHTRELFVIVLFQTTMLHRQKKIDPDRSFEESHVPYLLIMESRVLRNARRGQSAYNLYKFMYIGWYRRDSVAENGRLSTFGLAFAPVGRRGNMRRQVYPQWYAWTRIASVLWCWIVGGGPLLPLIVSCSPLAMLYLPEMNGARERIYDSRIGTNIIRRCYRRRHLVLTIERLGNRDLSLMEPPIPASRVGRSKRPEPLPMNNDMPVDTYRAGIAALEQTSRFIGLSDKPWEDLPTYISNYLIGARAAEFAGWLQLLPL
ncbi:hypothetical protein BC835DRAFT_1307691 [Cytidiella melzeri]|nr:hypothetical protein BC835DRAFT_1307691 [Cytidiella melzeri]